MPRLVNWMVHHPRYWTREDSVEYGNHMAVRLGLAMAPTVQILGAATSVNLLLALAQAIAVSNPDCIDTVLDATLDWAAELAKVQHPREGRVN